MKRDVKFTTISKCLNVYNVKHQYHSICDVFLSKTREQIRQRFEEEKLLRQKREAQERLEREKRVSAYIFEHLHIILFTLISQVFLDIFFSLSPFAHCQLSMLYMFVQSIKRNVFSSHFMVKVKLSQIYLTYKIYHNQM